MLTNIHCPDSFRRNFYPMSFCNHLPKQSEICYAIVSSVFEISKEQEIILQILAKPRNFSDVWNVVFLAMEVFMGCWPRLVLKLFHFSHISVMIVNYLVVKRNKHKTIAIWDSMRCTWSGKLWCFAILFLVMSWVN